MSTTAVEIKGQINAEVVYTITKLMEKILGKNTVYMILDRCQHQGNQNAGKQLVYAFAQETQNLLGNKGSYATLRQIGRSIAKTLMAQHPQTEWEHILKQTLNDFGFANKIEKWTDRAFICQCVFYDLLIAEGLQPTQHAVCWIGWGFIEGFIKEVEGIKGIEWVSRDVVNQKCEFKFR